jgi:hypothetical protein
LPRHTAKCTPGTFAAQPHPHADGQMLATHTQKADAALHAHPAGVSLRGGGSIEENKLWFNPTGVQAGFKNTVDFFENRWNLADRTELKNHWILESNSKKLKIWKIM